MTQVGKKLIKLFASDIVLIVLLMMYCNPMLTTDCFISKLDLFLYRQLIKDIIYGPPTNNFRHAYQIFSIKSKSSTPPVLNGQYQAGGNINQD